jgi:hypothetical protein
MEKVINEIELIGCQIQTTEKLLEKPFANWTPAERELHGSKDALRQEKHQLRIERQQLRDLQLIQERQVHDFNPLHLVGKFVKVNINQNCFMKKFLTPVGSPLPSAATTPPRIGHPALDLEQLSLSLDKKMLTLNTTTRPCLVLEVKELPLTDAFGKDYRFQCTIVLVTGFSGVALEKAIAPEEFSRVLPIHPTAVPSFLSASSIHSIPEWTTSQNQKVPSYVFCAAITVTLPHLFRLDNDCHVDETTLERIKDRVIACGPLTANTDYIDSDDSDDEEESSFGGLLDESDSQGRFFRCDGVTA